MPSGATMTAFPPVPVVKAPLSLVPDSTVAAADAGGVRTALGVYHTAVDGDGSAIVCVLTGADARAAGTAA